MFARSILKNVIGSTAASAVSVFLHTTTIQTRDSLIQKLQEILWRLS